MHHRILAGLVAVTFVGITFVLMNREQPANAGDVGPKHVAGRHGLPLDGGAVADRSPELAAASVNFGDIPFVSLQFLLFVSSLAVGSAIGAVLSVRIAE